jgi:hypothetical protein
MSREGTLLFGSLLMSLVALVGGALFCMRPDGVMALLILLFWSGGCGSGSFSDLVPEIKHHAEPSLAFYGFTCFADGLLFMLLIAILS